MPTNTTHPARSPAFDVLRCLCAFLIVYVHCPYPSVIGAYCITIARAGVPLFFMLSGYFYQQGAPAARQRKQIKKIFYMMLFANLLYFAWETLISLLIGRSPSAFFAQFFSMRQIVAFLCFNDASLAGHLWYLGAMLYTLCIVFVADRFSLHRWLMRLNPILLGIGLLLGQYSFLLGRTFPIALSRNFLFFGVPCFYLGQFIRIKSKQTEQTSDNKAPQTNSSNIVQHTTYSSQVNNNQTTQTTQQATSQTSAQSTQLAHHKKSAQKKGVFPKRKQHLFAALSILFICTSFLEGWYYITQYGASGECYLSSIALAVSVFLYTLVCDKNAQARCNSLPIYNANATCTFTPESTQQTPYNTVQTIPTHTARITKLFATIGLRYSAIIYIVHPLILLCANMIMAPLGARLPLLGLLYQHLGTLIIFVASAVFAICYQWVVYKVKKA